MNSTSGAIEDIYPLSPMQAGMLFHALYDAESAAYFVQLTWELQGDLKVAIFEQAWQDAVKRHPVLRSAIVSRGTEKPLQVVRSSVALPWTFHDWRELSTAGQRQELEQFLKSDREQGFDLSSAPLLRLSLIQVGAQSYYFVCSFHHVLLDGWSFSLVLKDVISLYGSLSQGKLVLLDAPRPYRDYIAWLQKQDFSKAEKFWRELLQGFDTPTSSRIDKTISNGVSQAEDYQSCHRHLGEEPTTRLQTFARQYQVTLNTMVQGAWALLLGRYSGEKDVVFGATVAGRPAELRGVESMVGLFINTLPVRVRITPEAQLVAWLKEIHKEQFRTRQYDYCQLADIQRWSEVPAATPLFDSLLIFENFPIDKAMREWEEKIGVTINGVSWVEQTNYPITLQISPGTQLQLHLGYDCRRYGTETIERLLGHLENLLAGMVADAGCKVGDLPLLGEQEKRQLLVEWNQTETEFHRDRCLQQLFEEQVERTPGALAVEYGGRQLTYAELNRRANQLAHRLRQLGVGPEVLVGIFVDRSLEMIVGLMAILKAGGAYVPFDPAYPQERLAFMLEDTRTPVLLTQHKLLRLLPSHQAQTICLDDADWKDIATCPDGNPVVNTGDGNLAYIIYTSGSTGKPKGVQITHFSLCNIVAFSARRFELDGTSRLTQVASLNFDASVFEIFVTLTVGASLHLVNARSLLSGPEFQDLVLSKRITMLGLSPSLLNALPQSEFPDLKTIGVGGETCSPQTATRWSRNRRFFNAYAPTETTIYSTVYEASGLETEIVPVGKPVDNTQVHILDREMELLPVGVPGELHIGGVGLARGYLRRPELTAERFIPDPFSTVAGKRLYRTGDQARWQPDGTIEFLGRVDYQVKIRGFRIELGEIEAVLEQHNEVSQAVVIAREDRPGDKRLVAYVVPTPDAKGNLAGGGLRNYLKTKLPDYMVPSAFMELASIPLTVNAKIDRRALPAPEHAGQDVGYVAPRTPVEEMLAAIWSEVLGVQRVGVFDNFFELGGHSLLAAQVVSRIRKSWITELPLKSLFEEATLAGLAAVIEQHGREKYGVVLPPIEPVGRDREIPLSFAQQRLWFLEQLEPGNSAYHMTAAVQLDGPLDVSALQRSLTEMVRRHESLRTVFPAVQGRAVQVVKEAQGSVLRQMDLQGLEAAQQQTQISKLLEECSQESFDLVTGPLLRAILLRCAPDQHVLQLTMHHIVSDGWSMGVLVSETAALYRSYVDGSETPLRELKIQYPDFAVWQREWMEAGRVETQLEYWRKQLAAPQSLELPTDHPRSKNLSHEGNTEQGVLGPELTAELKKLARRENVTLFMLLLAAYQVMLSRYAKQNDVAVGTPIASRNREEIEGLIGFFVNTLVMRTRLQGDETFLQVLKQVKEVALGAYAHQDVPFEKLVDEVQPERDLGQTPLFQVMFVFQNTPLRDMDLGELKLSAIEPPQQGAQFDLTLEMSEGQTGIRVGMHYRCSLFEAGTIRSMLANYEELLKAVVANPKHRIWELSMLRESEKRQLLVEWNKTEGPTPRESSIHELFEAQVEANRSVPAVQCGADCLTYGELNERANRLAHRLRELKVGPEVLVGICTERTVEMVVGLLGILKAGGAYVPLDPAYPKERLAFMLEDTGAPVLLTQQKLLGQLPSHRAQLICLDSDWEDIASRSDHSLPAVAGSLNTAYVIYTSGSTGQPKGVAIPHQSAVAFLHWTRASFTAEELSGVLASTSVCFDLSIFELFGPLSWGGRIILVENALRLPELSADANVKLINTVPSAISELLKMNGVPASVCTVSLAGEPLQRSLVNQVYTLSHIRQVLNLYGPTEYTTYSTYVRLEKSDQRPVTIGAPLANTQVYILDEWMTPTPIGVPGELHIGGAGLARGYLKRPRLTAERFVANPFGGAGERLYKTGDLARWRVDGKIEFVGRIDHQVKVHGFRIELGEIETVLQRYEGVQQAVVVAREDTPGEKRLVAYVVNKTGGTPAGSELRNYLRSKLPDYMVPGAFVELDALPLTANGKINRLALPAPERGGGEVEKGYIAPQTPVEETLADIWSAVLGIGRVGVHDNFFDLGGDSILSIQIVARAQQAGIPFTARQMFEEQTIAGIARLAGTASVIQAEQGIVTGEAPITPIQQWFFTQQLGNRNHFNQAVLVGLKEELNQALVEKVVEGLLQQHDALRMRYRHEDGQWKQENLGYEDVKRIVQRVDLRQIEEGRQKTGFEEEAQRWQGSLDIENGPVLRVVLIDVHDGQRLLVIAHHLVVDGVSWRILLEDFEHAYRQLRSGAALAFVRKTSSFKQWAEGMQEYAQSKSLSDEIGYWREVERNRGESLPIDGDREENLEQWSESLTTWLSEEDTRSLLHEVPKVYRTQINEVLLTAWIGGMQQAAGVADILVDMEGHGREEILESVDITRTVGWFASLYPVRLEWKAGEDWGKALKRIKEQLRAMPQRGIGYGLLRYLGKTVGERLGEASHAEVSFNYSGQMDQGLGESAIFKAGVTESSGASRSSAGRRSHLLDINGGVQGGQLYLIWSYGSRIQSRERVEGWAEAVRQALRSLIEHCRQVKFGSYTPSDFLRVNLSQEALDAIVSADKRIENIYPPTPMQQGMLFHSLYSPQSGVYVQQVSCRLRGKLQLDAFEQSWNQALNRHETLRSSFVWAGLEQAVQVVEEGLHVNLDREDWRGMEDSRQREMLDSLLEADRIRGFHPQQAPLMRLTLIQLAEQDYCLVWSYHHLLLDGWSLPIVMNDIFAAYEALSHGRQPDLGPPSLYREYVRWLQHQDRGKAKEFWRQRLRGFRVPTDFEVEIKAELATTAEAEKKGVLLSELATQGLEELARRQQLTMNTLMQGMWGLLLSRYTGMHEVVFGATVSGRPGDVAGIEKLVGVLINTQPVRVAVDLELGLVQWLKNIQQQQVEQRQYEYSSLADIQRWSDVPPGTSLFNSILVFQNFPVESLATQSASELQISDVHWREQTNYPLEIMVSPGKRLSIGIIYSTGKYSAEAVRQVLKDMLDLLERMAVRPGAVLADLLFAEGMQPAELVASRDDLAPVPLSYHQERLYFIDRFETGTIYESSPVYHNLPLPIRLEGPVDTLLLERSLREIVSRHDALQVQIVEQDGQAFQIKDHSSTISLAVVEIGGGHSGIDRELALRLVLDEVSIPFILSRPPLIRATLFRCSPVESLLVIVVHHIVADNRSLQLIAKELEEVYDAFSRGRVPRLHRSKFSHTDYARWQRSTPEQSWSPYWSYWKRVLGGERANLELPLKRPRHAIHVFKSAIHEFSISADHADAVRSLSATAHVSPRDIFLTAYYAMLLIYSGQEGFFVGLTADGRLQPGTEKLVGPFSNLLAFRCRSVGPTFAGLLKTVAQTVRQEFERQAMPFELITQKLDLPKDMSRTVLFDVLFQYDGEAPQTLKLRDVRGKIIETNLGHGKYDLNLQIQAAYEGLSALFAYNDQLFHCSTIEQMARHYQVLLGVIIASPERLILEAGLLNEREKQQQIQTWNATGAEYPFASTIHQIFEEQVLNCADSTAITAGEQNLSYSELNRQANRLAHLLRSQGVVPDTLVAICLDRSVEMVVAIMAVLKAGGAYLPMDPLYPEERLSFLLQDARVSHLVTQAEFVGRFSDQIPWVTALDRDHDRINSQPQHNLESASVAGSLAYCIYTSGSTGRPNGVLVEHGNVVRLMKNSKFYFDFSENDVWTLFHSYCFDFSVWEIFGALLYGGRVVVPAAARDHQVFQELLCREKVTVLNQTPAAFYSLAAHVLDGPKAELALRYVIFGGEALQPAALKDFRDIYPAIQLINMYGITETTVHVTFRKVMDHDMEFNTSNIGVPIPTTTTYIMSPHMELLPVGVRGEMYVGGKGVARGYLNRPHLSAARFIPDPFAAGSGNRLYRTGDLARYRDDGTLEYLGRIDDQVKIRGFRIELGEIDTALASHPEVERSLVIARPDRLGEKQIVAYFVLASRQAVNHGELRSYLKERLPEYMVPALFVELEQMPLTVNGKVDRKALPEPEAGGADLEREYTAPRTPVEETLCGIWAEILGVDRVGIHDSFFELGGHSLLAMQLVSWVRKVYQSEIELRRIFEQPTVAGLAALIAREPETSAMPLFERISCQDDLPLSFAQQRLWFMDRLEPESDLFNMPMALRLSGRLNKDSFQRALKEIVRRHEVLRTRFLEWDGLPVQRIVDESEFGLSLEEIDLRGAGEQTRQEEITKYAQQEATTGFDLGRGPLLRVKLLQLAPQEHALLLTMHHIVSDGWSLGVLVSEFAGLYNAYAEGKSSPLPDLEFQYADYAVWQRRWLQGKVLEQQMGYWKGRLTAVPTLELPTDHPRRMLDRSAADVVGRPLSRDLSGQLRELARHENVTLFMLMMATLQVMLWRLTEQNDFAVGTPIANRNRKETEPLIGFFINTLVLRAKLHDQQSFRSLLQQVKETALGAYTHQDVPFEKLVEELQPERDMGQTPLFQVLLDLQNAPMPEMELRELKLSPIEQRTRRAQVDLRVEVTERDAEIFIGMHYRHELFEPETMWRMLGHYEELLKSLVAAPGLGIMDLSLLREEEKLQLVVEWNRTEVDFPRDKCIHQLFEEKVERSPHAVAVEYGDLRLTYAELNRKANQLAHWLRDLGVRPEMLVALCTERSPEMVVGLLGILKAGGAYVPLDPAYPLDRLSFMLEDTQAPVLLTQQKLIGQLPQHMGILASLDEDADWQEIARHPDHNPEVNTTPESMAYVIYTSGSTGKPKGSMNIHRGLCNLALEQARLFQVREGKGILQFASFSFDAATWEWAMALINGARLIMASRETLLPGPQLIELLQRSRTSVVTLPPTVLALFPEDVELQDLETVVVAGEACSAQLAARWGAKCRMHNAYGPSETTVCSTVSDPLDGKQVPSIGRPIANVQMYVLNSRMEPVPVGVQGELYIGGAGLARGYVRWPELTAERFVPHPFSRHSGDRLYRTGDLGRWKADGTIEFRGRLDHQVKVRGFRIELGEVESALERHKDVKQAVVIAREDRPGDKRLVGYVMMNDRESAASTSELRAYLRSKLPNYMVPGALVRLESVPLNANGKVDRNALPAPQESFGDGEHEYQAPRTPMEEVLAAIWAELLGVERVGVHDNFFELGGHSLLATQVVSRVRKDLNLEVPLNSMFAEPTVAAVAHDLEQYGREKHGLILPPIQPVERNRDLPLSFAQQRLWFIEQLQPGNRVFNLPVAVRLTGPLNVEALEKSLDAIVRRHEVLRTVFTSMVGEPLQRIQNTEKIGLEIVDLHRLEEEEKHAQMQKRLLEDAEAAFDLSEGPLLRALLLQLGDDHHVLQLAMHHIVSDGWSMGVLVGELVTLYNAYADGREPALKELNIQYADYAAWQREWMQTAVLERQLDYWRKQLQGMEALGLTPDRPAPKTPAHCGGLEKLEIEAEVKEKLKAVTQRQGVTLFMTMLAALQVLLHCLTDREDIAVGTNIANRNRKEIEGLIGFFVNTLVLRTSLTGDPNFHEVLQRVQQVTLGAYANQDLPFDRLVEELRPERETGHAPLFRIKVTMGNTPQQTAGMHGLSLTLLPPEVIYAESDLVFFFGETEKGLGASVVYDSDLYRAATASHVLSQFSAVLRTVAKDPGMRLSEIKALLAEHDKRYSRQQEEDLESKARQKLRTKRRSAAAAITGGKGEK